MKFPLNFFRFILIAVLLVLFLGAWRMQTPAAGQATTIPTVSAAAQTEACDSSRSVQVSGAAVINVVPDRALLQLGVQSNGTTPESVQNSNQMEIQKVINVVRSLGVEAKDIATDYYIAYPIYEDYNALTIKGYRIDNTVSITLRDVNLVDDVILATLKVGANQVQDVQFYTSELRKYRDQARELAMKAAAEKAQALAGAAGTQTGCVLTISENTWSQYYGSWRGGRDANLWAQNVIQNAAPAQGGNSAAMDDAPVSLGQIAVRAEVSASYHLQ